MTLSTVNNFGAIEAALKEFLKNPSEITETLNNYLQFISKTGKTIFFWENIKPLVIHKFIKTADEFLATNKSFSDKMDKILSSAQKTLAQFTQQFEEAKRRILLVLHGMIGIPFSIQRICELLIDPYLCYDRVDHFLTGFERVIRVVSTIDPTGQKIVNENEEAMYNISSVGDFDEEVAASSYSANLTSGMDRKFFQSIQNNIEAEIGLLDKSGSTRSSPTSQLHHHQHHRRRRRQQQRRANQNDNDGADGGDATTTNQSNDSSDNDEKDDEHDDDKEGDNDNDDDDEEEEDVAKKAAIAAPFRREEAFPLTGFVPIKSADSSAFYAAAANQNKSVSQPQPHRLMSFLASPQMTSQQQQQQQLPGATDTFGEKKTEHKDNNDDQEKHEENKQEEREEQKEVAAVSQVSKDAENDATTRDVSAGCDSNPKISQSNSSICEGSIESASNPAGKRPIAVVISNSQSEQKQKKSENNTQEEHENEENERDEKNEKQQQQREVEEEDDEKFELESPAKRLRLDEQEAERSAEKKEEGEAEQETKEKEKDNVMETEENEKDRVGKLDQEVSMETNQNEEEKDNESGEKQNKKLQLEHETVERKTDNENDTSKDEKNGAASAMAIEETAEPEKNGNIVEKGGGEEATSGMEIKAN